MPHKNNRHNRYLANLGWSCQDNIRQITVTIKLRASLRACLHEDGGPQVGEVTCGGLPHLTCKCDYIKMRDYMDRRVTPPKWVTSPTWGPPPPYKQALRLQTVRILRIQVRASSQTKGLEGG